MSTTRTPVHGFLILLVGLVALLLVPSYFEVHERHMLLQLMLSGVLMAPLYLVASSLRQLLLAGTFVMLVLLGSWWPSDQLGAQWSFLSSCLTILFLAYLISHLARFLARTTEVTRDMIYASICLYLVLGLLWAFIYLAIEIRSPGSLTLSAENIGDPRSLLGHFSYFSYVTLSTLGYGDIAPVSRIARSWATLEAIAGQFYLAIVVARLVGMHLAKNLKDGA